MSILDKFFKLFTRSRSGSGSFKPTLPTIHSSRALPIVTDEVLPSISDNSEEKKTVIHENRLTGSVSTIAFNHAVLIAANSRELTSPFTLPAPSAWEREGGINETVILKANLVSFSAAHMTENNLDAFKAEVHSVCASEVISALPTNGDLVYRGGTLDTQLCHSFRQTVGRRKEPKREGAAFSNITRTSFLQKFLGEKIKPLVDDYLSDEKFGFFRLVLDSSDYQKIMDSLAHQINSHVFHGGPKIIGTSTSKTFELALLFSLCRAQMKLGVATKSPTIMGQVGVTIGMDPSYYPYRLDVNYAEMINTGGIDEEGMTKWVSLESSAYENEMVMLSHHIFQHRFAVITQLTKTDDDKLEICFKTLVFNEINIEYAFPKDDKDFAKRSADLMELIGKEALKESQTWTDFQAALLSSAEQHILLENYTNYILMLKKTHDSEKQLIHQAYKTALRLVASGETITIPLAPERYDAYKQMHWSVLNKYEPHYNLLEAEEASLFSLQRKDDCVRLTISDHDGIKVKCDYSVYEIRTMMAAFLAMNLERAYGDDVSLSIRQNSDIDLILSDPNARNRLSTYLLDKLSRENKITNIKYPIEVENVTNRRVRENVHKIR